MKNILITGASSGIGEALALHYAGKGIHLFISGRHADRLEQTAQECQKAGATVHCRIIDVCDRPAMKDWIDGIEKNTPLDLVIANAGISGGTGGQQGRNYDTDIDIFATNLNGVMNTIHPALDHMSQRKKGQIAIISSVASFAPMAGAPAYAASKTAVRYYGEALGAKLKKDNIHISVICPGFIESRMTDANDFPMPFIMPAPKAAKLIEAAITKKKPRYVFPWQMRWVMRIVSLMPDKFTRDIFAQVPEKHSHKKNLP